MRNCMYKVMRRAGSYLESQLVPAARTAGHGLLLLHEVDGAAGQRLHGVTRGAHQLPEGARANVRKPIEA